MDWRNFSYLLIGVLLASAFWILVINTMATRPEKEFPIGCRQGDVLFESNSGVTYLCNESQEWRPRVKETMKGERKKDG